MFVQFSNAVLHVTLEQELFIKGDGLFSVSQSISTLKKVTL